MADCMKSAAAGDMFKIIKNLGKSGVGARLGQFSIKNKTLQTPHYLAVTSRGAVPHISQDTFARDTQINSVYVPLEDFVEKYPYETPPLYKYTAENENGNLRSFVALPKATLLVLGARRTPPVAAPAANSNTDSTVAICTSVGFRTLEVEDYAEEVEKLGADIVIAMGDIPYERALVPKRLEKAVDRQIDWLQNHVNLRTEHGSTEQAALIAPVLPTTCDKQRFYLDWLVDHIQDVSGLAVYDIESTQDLPDALHALARFGFTTPATPHEVLRHIALGIDVVTVPFITAATDAGIALDFSFGADLARSSLNITVHEPLALGVDMWPTDHATDLSALTEGCTCYACTTHHRAYLQHLLAAKEMLGWVLLQVHNHHIIERFFSAIRQSFVDETYDEDVEKFNQVYESHLPEKTGRGPRVRGYQFKSEGPGEAKKNVQNFTPYNDKQEKNKDDPALAEGLSAVDLETKGFASQP